MISSRSKNALKVLIYLSEKDKEYVASIIKNEMPHLTEAVKKL